MTPYLDKMFTHLSFPRIEGREYALLEKQARPTGATRRHGSIVREGATTSGGACCRWRGQKHRRRRRRRVGNLIAADAGHSRRPQRRPAPAMAGVAEQPERPCTGDSPHQRIKRHRRRALRNALQDVAVDAGAVASTGDVFFALAPAASRNPICGVRVSRADHPARIVASFVLRSKRLPARRWSELDPWLRTGLRLRRSAGY